jgi:hypothetical protein
VGDEVRAGDPVLRVLYRSSERLGDALPLLDDAVLVSESPGPSMPMVMEEVV